MATSDIAAPGYPPTSASDAVDTPPSWPPGTPGTPGAGAPPLPGAVLGAALPAAAGLPRRSYARKAWAAAAVAVVAVTGVVLAVTLSGSGSSPGGSSHGSSSPSAGPPPPLHTGTPSLARTLTVPGRATVDFAQVSPDGKLVAATDLVAEGKQTTVYLWNAVTGASLRTLSVAGSAVDWLAFPPDDKSMLGVVSATTGGEELYRWDLVTGTRTLVRSMPSTGRWALSGDDNKMATEAGNTITVTNVNTGAVIARLALPGTAPVYNGSHVSLDSDGGRLIAANANGTAYVWDVATRKIIDHVPYSYKINSAVANLTFYPRLSPDGKTVLVFANDNQKGPSSLWDVATGANITPDDPRWPKNDQGCAFSEDGRVCATGTTDDKTVDVWDVATGNFLLSVTDPHNVKDGGLADIGPADSSLVVLGPVNSNFESTSLYVWDVP
jgi:WD40 repeat protein